jgi:cellulose synthase operon protein C
MSEGRILAWTAELLDERLEQQNIGVAEPEGPPPPSDWRHAEAAAVLATFDPKALKPMAGSASSEAMKNSLRFLLENSVPAPGRRTPRRWRLGPGVRREALARLGDRRAIREACERNPDAGDSLREAFLAISEGSSALDLSTFDYRKLLVLGEAVELLEGIVDELPDKEAIAQATERATVFEPLRALTGSWFRGRRRELAELAEYVEVLPTTTTLRSLRRSARIRLRGHERPPLLVLGPGGIGKSTLLAKFILEHVERGDVVFAYLDFDRPMLSGSEPGTILLEAARQIAVQGDEEHARRWAQARRRWAGMLTKVASEDPGATGFAARATAQIELIDLFADEFEHSFPSDQPLLLALDTFEEVQYHSREFADTLWQFLDALSDRLPMLRTVLAGRAPIEKRRTEVLELEALDEEAAIGFLEGHGVNDHDAARLLVERLGCSPLTLRLAVELMRRDECDLSSTEGVSRSQRLFALHLDEKTLQVELYRRILDHIHTADVRKLAHPGLVLPRITPELIRYVLAEPCDVEVDSDQRALELFAELGREIALVRISDDGALEHRPELRRAMLPMMREDEPATVAEIHGRAVVYHAGREGDRDREAEIYHRLALGEDPKQMDALWSERLGSLLRRSLGDLPAAAQAYLATRLDVEVDPEARHAASREDEERDAANSARDFLKVGRPADALKVLKKTRDRPAGSALYLCEALAHQALGELDAAIAVVDRALEPAPARASFGSVSKLLTLAAEIETARGPSRDAAERADQAYEFAYAREFHAQVARLAVMRLRNWRALVGVERKDRRVAATFDSRRAQTVEDLLKLPATIFLADPDSAEALAGEIGADSSMLLKAIALTVGLPTLRRERVRKAVILWNREYRKRLEVDAAAVSLMETPGSGEPGPATEVLLGLMERHPLTKRAAGSIATEIRYILSDQNASRS